MYRVVFMFALSLVSIIAAAQTVATPPDGADYRVITVKSPVNGQPVHLLICNNGTTECSYKWNELCVQGQATNTDPMGGVGEAPAYMRDKTGAPMRMFVCKS